jgi:hypothetical protein
LQAANIRESAAFESHSLRHNFSFHLSAAIFLRSLGIKVVTGRDAPKYVEEMPDVYTQEELDVFLLRATRLSR